MLNEFFVLLACFLKNIYYLNILLTNTYTTVLICSPKIMFTDPILKLAAF